MGHRRGAAGADEHKAVRGNEKAREKMTRKASMRMMTLVAGVAALALMAQGAAAEVVKVHEKGLNPYEIVDGISIPKPLTNKPGDPKRGAKLVVARKKGNCLACHKIQQLNDFPFHGNIGPELSDVASNMKEGEMRLRLVNSKVINPDTIMPAFYRTEGLHRVKKKFKGKPVLTEQEIEDIIAFLKTLKASQ